MTKPPKELIKQLENIEKVVSSLNDLINTDKIKIQHYGTDFLKDLSGIQQDGIALRAKLVSFKEELESSLTEQYDPKSLRFAAEVVKDFLTNRS